jgi:hypothetical protein
VGTRSLSSGAHSRDPLALPNLWTREPGVTAEMFDEQFTHGGGCIAPGLPCALFIFEGDACNSSGAKRAARLRSWLFDI